MVYIRRKYLKNLNESFPKSTLQLIFYLAGFTVIFSAEIAFFVWSVANIIGEDHNLEGTMLYERPRFIYYSIPSAMINVVLFFYTICLLLMLLGGSNDGDDFDGFIQLFASGVYRVCLFPNQSIGKMILTWPIFKTGIQTACFLLVVILMDARKLQIYLDHYLPIYVLFAYIFNIAHGIIVTCFVLEYQHSLLEKSELVISCGKEESQVDSGGERPEDDNKGIDV
jgi:hypothetical protein